MRTPTDRTWRRTMLVGAGAVAVIAAPLMLGLSQSAEAGEVRLEPFAGCGDLAAYAKGAALAQLDDQRMAMPRALAAQEDAATAAAPATGGSAGADVSTTNVQEAGIDEPDIVKTDGRTVFAIAGTRLHAVDVTGPAPRIAGSVSLPDQTFPRDMLLSGGRLLVIADGPFAALGGAEATADMIMPAGGATLIEVDVSDPAAMRVGESMRTEARYVSARMNGSVVRVVLAADGPLRMPMDAGDAMEDPGVPLARYRDRLRATTADNWVPRATMIGRDGAVRDEEPLVDCTDVSRPRRATGTGTLTVLTIDLGRGIAPVDRDAVMTGGDTVMASAGNLYVGSPRTTLRDGTWDTSTDIHVFATGSGDTTEYRGSGSVDGTLLNQFAMSEFDGRLRVATTIDRGAMAGPAIGVAPGAAMPARSPDTESAVTVLAMDGRTLRTTGRVAGLGKGERIHSARFIGNAGYVVTFRRTDPLYVVDLRDPSAPRVTGELKIPGYSAYLHPVGDGRLLGIGQDADAQGRVRGLQASLFDVSDPARPARVATWTAPGAGTEVEWDHHAFLWWAPARLAVLPFQRYQVAEPAAGGDARSVTDGGVVDGMVALRVGGDGIGRAGTVDPPPDAGAARRSVVVGDDLLTLTERGVAVSALSDLSPRAWLPFGG